MNERFDFGFFVSPVVLADFQTWTLPAEIDVIPGELRSSPGRRPRVIETTKSASSRWFGSVHASLLHAGPGGFQGKHSGQRGGKPCCG